MRNEMGFVWLTLLSILSATQSRSADCDENNPPFSVVAVLEDDRALSEAHDVELLGSHAFVAGKGSSIAIVDVSNLERPRLVWFRSDPELLHDSETVLPFGDHLFLGTDNFHSIDIRDPSKPKFDANLIDSSRIQTINGMVRRDSCIIAANKEGILNAFDITKPSSPKLVGMLKTAARFQITSPHDVDLYGEYAVVVDPNRFGQRPGSLALFRIFDSKGQLLPDSEWDLAGRIASDKLNGANRVQVQGDHAYVGGSYSPRYSAGRALAKGVVIDLSNPKQPREVACVSFPDVRGPNGLTIAGAVWFLAGGQTVDAYDIRKPTRPRRLASFRSTEAFPTADDNAHDLIYRDGYVFVTGQGDNRFVIMQVKNDVIRRLAGLTSQNKD